MEQGYSAGMARAALGVSQRCLDYWEERGVIQASFVASSGKGSQRLYSFHDLVQISVVKELRDAGLSLQKIRKAIKVLRKKLKHEGVLLKERFYTDGQTLHRITDDPRFLEDTLDQGQLVMSVIALGKLADLGRRLVKLDDVVRKRGRPIEGSLKRRRRGGGS